MLSTWILSRLETAASSPYIIVRDPLRLIKSEIAIDDFAREKGYSAIIASTNLVFRQLYSKVSSDREIERVLLVDQTPSSRREKRIDRAPPLFYPDLLAKTPPEARFDLDIWEFLKEETGDPNWPREVSSPIAARMIIDNLSGVIRAHSNLRASDPIRFTDHDLKTIIAFAVLDIPDRAFRTLDSRDLLALVLLKRDDIQRLEEISPDIIAPIRDKLESSQPPFCYFRKYSSDKVVRAFYLSAILSQHIESWNLLLAHVDPQLMPLSTIDSAFLKREAPEVVRLHPAQASADIADLEASLTPDALRLILLDQIRLHDPNGFAEVLEKENYSTLFRSLALFMALRDLLDSETPINDHRRLYDYLINGRSAAPNRFVEQRDPGNWNDLLKAYRLAYEVRQIIVDLAESLRKIKLSSPEQQTFQAYWDIWNGKRANRLEYFLSDLTRMAEGRGLLPRDGSSLPEEFTSALSDIRTAIEQITAKAYDLIDRLNAHYQDFVKAKYPLWISADDEVILTSQFIRRCLKPHWDPEKEKAVLLIFDGMRYDIWDELLRPRIIEWMEMVKEYHASSLLPTETKISRWAISAGAYPEGFDSRKAENLLLQKALEREFSYRGEVDVINPEGAGTGETVRYRAGNLDVYIFDLCDKALHNIRMKTLQDQRKVPAMPMSFIYHQIIEEIIRKEVGEIVRSLAPETKVFITADHGFVHVSGQPLFFSESDLNRPQDCLYLHCMLKKPLAQSSSYDRVKQIVVDFKPSSLRIPASFTSYQDGKRIIYEYKSVVFPRPGYYFNREQRHEPFAFTHGGISLQEMIIPMVVLKVRSEETGSVLVEWVQRPERAMEGEAVEFRLRLKKSGKVKEGRDIKVDLEAFCSFAENSIPLPHKVAYLGESEIVYKVSPDLNNLSAETRRRGEVRITLTISYSYRDGKRQRTETIVHTFAIRLNSERLVRLVGNVNLGNILGLMPRSMR